MYIATNPGEHAIFGLGETPEDARREADSCGGSSLPQGLSWRVYECTDVLADYVRTYGGARVSWRVTDDVAHLGELD